MTSPERDFPTSGWRNGKIARRAVDNCIAPLEALDRKGRGQSTSPFGELYVASQQSRVRIVAENSPYDSKII